MTRSVPEWRGKTPDTPIPARVKLRIWEREGGRCYLTGRKIQPRDAYEYEHVIALSCGGEHRESNIRLALKEPHKVKSAKDLGTKAKIARVRLKHLGLWPKAPRPIPSRPFPKRERAR
jgi:5-methylcytosine-specific restriction enzyme A